MANLANVALALLFWMIIGRAALRLITGGRPGFFAGVFEKATEPAYVLVRRATFGVLPERWVPVVTLVLVLLVRIALVPLLREGPGSGTG